MFVLSCRSAQFEHTVVITADGVDILTKLPEESSASNWWALASAENLHYLLGWQMEEITEHTLIYTVSICQVKKKALVNIKNYTYRYI